MGQKNLRSCLLGILVVIGLILIGKLALVLFLPLLKLSVQLIVGAIVVLLALAVYRALTRR